MPDVLHTLQSYMRAWNAVDWTIAVCLAFSTGAAFAKGLISSLVSLVGLCLAVAAAVLYAPRSAPVLLGWFGSAMLARVMAFLLILLAVYAAVALLGRLLRGVCRAAGLGLPDRLAGAAFGFVRGVLLLGALALPFATYLQHSAEGETSVLLPYLLRASLGVSSVVPHDAAGQVSFDRWAGWAHLPDAGERRHKPEALR